MPGLMVDSRCSVPVAARSRVILTALMKGKSCGASRTKSSTTHSMMGSFFDANSGSASSHAHAARAACSAVMWWKSLDV